MSAQTLTLPNTQHWIISRRDDLIFFCGSALFGYLLALWALSAGRLPTRFMIAFAFAIDGPHVYSTATRGLFDGKERRRFRLLWFVALPLCLAIGPLVVSLAGGTLFLTMVATLSHLHISKQHMGFVMIYKRKARERDDFKFDKYATLALLILPFLFYLSALLTQSTRLLLVFLVPSVAIAGWFIAHQIRKENRNIPKLILIGSFVPLQWIAWSFAAMEPSSLGRVIIAAAITNVGHSLQYLRLMWFHNHNRYGERIGFLGLISRKWIYFFATAVVLAAIPVLTANVFTWPLFPPLVTGFLFFHFVLDSKLWRIRGDKELGAALHLN